MQDLYVDSNEGVVFKHVISVAQGCEKQPLQRLPRLGLISSKLSI